MSGLKPAALAAWGSSALRPVELPTGTRALVILPNVQELIRRDALPEDLRKLAMQYATTGIEIAKISDADVAKFVRFTYELVARMVKYLAPVGSNAWEGWRERGDPTTDGWEPVSLTGAEVAEMQVDQADIDALAAIAARQKTPNEITAASRRDRGLLVPELPEEEGRAVRDFADLRRQPDGADAGGDGEGVRSPPERAARDRGPGHRVRARRGARAAP